MALAELEASNTRPPRKPIHSHQSEILAELDWLLSDSDRPLRLRKNIDRLKLLLMDAWVIQLELNAGTLKLMAHKGEVFTRPAARGGDDLSVILIEILREGGDGISSKLVLEKLKQYEGKGVIQEVEGDGAVQWISSRGKEKTTQFHSIEDRLSKYRKNL